MVEGNYVLGSLPATVRTILENDLVDVQLSKSQPIYAPGEVIGELYFPTTALISAVVTMGSGKMVEAAILGNREVAGIQAFLGVRELSQTRTFVQMSGHAFRLGIEFARKMFDSNAEFRGTMLRGVQALLAQVSQNAACNRLHPVERRFARWLLDVRDRVGTDRFMLTQELAGEMLGVRRVTITEVENTFAERGWIANTRGSVEILDASGLLENACECHAVLVQEYERLFPAIRMRNE